MPSKSDRLMFTIADAARIIGVSASTLRLWEDEGLVDPERSPTGYRRYSADDIERLRRIRQMRQHDRLGISAIRASLCIPETDHRTLARPARTAPSGWPTKLKRLRVQSQMTLRQAAVAAELSPSFISAIERGATNPSVAALQRLTAAYRTSIVELMEVPSPPARSLVTHADRRRYDVVSGVHMEQLNFGPHRMELHLFTVEPSAGSGGTYQHEGEEFIFVMHGELEVWLDEIERYLLQPGDVLYFESHRLHRWRNSGVAKATFLGVNTPPTF